MDASFWTELITTLGFPIALVIALCWFIFKIYNQSVEREQRLMTEITENRRVNEQAIQTLTLYAERLDNIETDIKEIKDIVSHE